jgi:hypothetical protein
MSHERRYIHPRVRGVGTTATPPTVFSECVRVKKQQFVDELVADLLQKIFPHGDIPEKFSIFPVSRLKE